MSRRFEPRIVTQLLERVDARGTVGSEFFLVLYAIRAVALAVSMLASLGARTPARA